MSQLQDFVIIACSGFVVSGLNKREANDGKRGVKMEVVMKTSLMVLAVLLVAVLGALGVMNDACKSGRHVWCKPAHVSDMRGRGGSS